MIDPHIATDSFCQQVQNEGYLVVDKASGLAGRTFTKRLESNFTDITEFVGTIVSKKEELSVNELLELKSSYSKICKTKIRWYHKVLAVFVPSYKKMVAASRKIEADLLDQINLVQKSQLAKMHQYVDTTIQEHLQPYLTGQITEATQDKNRGPLRDTLYPAVKHQFPQLAVDGDDIEALAFDAYIMHAAEHFIKQLPALVPDAPEWKDDVSEIIEATKKAVAIDFSPGFLDQQNVQKATLEALWAAIQKKNTTGLA